MKKASKLISILAMCLLTACSEPQNSALAVATPVALEERYSGNLADNDIGSSINQFTYEMCAEILKEPKTNLCFSPLSLYYALALTASGAKGKTQDEMMALLNADHLDLSQKCDTLYRLLYKDSPNAKMKIANSVWLDTGYMYNEGFQQNAANHFYSSLFSVDFSSRNTAEQIEKWISENTNGALSPEIDISNSTMSIINTIYLNYKWFCFPKESTKEDTFYLDNNGQVRCDFMNGTLSNNDFSIGEGYARAALPLGKNSNMVFILPDEGVSIADLLSSPQNIERIFTQGSNQTGQVVWKVPKFKYKSSLKLKETLKKLGIVSAFSPGADFSGIADDVYLTSVLQETQITVNEDGVEASAYTQINGTIANAPHKDDLKMNLNRPFLYGITANNIPVFIGICMNPAS